MWKRAITVSMAAAVLAAGVASAADGPGKRNRTIDATVQTERGEVKGTRTTVRDRGFRSRTQSVTGPNGGTRTSEAVQTRSRGDGVRVRTDDRSRTFANGDVASRSATKSWDSNTGVGGKTVNRTFRDGSTRSVDTGVVKTGDGAFDASRTVTGRDGETREQTGSFTVTNSPE